MKSNDNAADVPAAGGQPMVPAEAETVVLEEDSSNAISEDRGVSAVSPRASLGESLAGRFTLVELIGEGGMSRVYRALDSRAASDSPSRFVALKVLTRPVADAPGALRSEVAKLAALIHPNIVRTNEFGCDGDNVFITMELLGGSSLYAALRDGTRLDGVGIVRAIAGALDFAHENGVVHGDLKPGNVMLADVPKVIDFSIAALVARPQSAMERREAARTRSALAVTPRYASPQLMARSAPTPADDVYALACIAYEVLSGVHPFESGPDGQPLTYPPRERSGLTATQYSAIVAGLQFDRQNRTSRVKQFLAEFDRPDRPDRPDLAERAEPFETIRRPSKLITIATVSAVVVVAAIICWTYLRPSRQTAPVTHPALTEAASTLPPALEKPGSVVRDCADCAPMMVLPAGSFLQGAAPGEAGAAAADMPSHAVKIAAPIIVSIDDVTVADFARFVAATGRDMTGCDIYDGSWRVQTTANWTNPGFQQAGGHPVTCVSWRDAVAYAAWLSTQVGHTYRLPSASEWEYASRAGLDTSRPWEANSSDACKFANVADASAARRYPGWTVLGCDDGYVYTSPVGSFRANAFGLHDMLGNVFQWTQDCWHADYSGASTDGSARVDGECREHELRGGSWFSNAKFLSASHRNRFATDYRTSSVGFRLVREVGQ